MAQARTTTTKISNTKATNNHHPNKPTSSNPKASSNDDKTKPTPMDTDESKVKNEGPRFTEHKLLAAYDPQLKHNVLKFAPSSDRKIQIDSMIRPIKLNRKDPWAIRKKAEEEKRRLTTKAEDNGQDDDLKMQIESDSKPSTTTPASTNNKPTRDDSIIAPAPASQLKLKPQPFKKKTKQVFIASDQAARMLRKEEYQSWLLEDGSTNGERWVGRYESAGAATGSRSGPSSNSTLSNSGHQPKLNNDASNYVLFRFMENSSDFQVIPCHRFYRFTQRPAYDTLGPDEAEAAYEKMQKPTTKEDVGRWFMRRRGLNSNGESSKASNDANLEGNLKPSQISFFDESKISFASSNKLRPQVEIPSFVNGRRNKFTAVQGSSNPNLDGDDEDRKPKFGPDGDIDEVDYEQEFEDDEEGAGNLNDEAMEEDEVKELAEKLRREQLAAGKAGEDNKEDLDIDKDDLTGERADLTKEGKAVKKLLMRKGEDNVYNSDDDDDVRNPYASEEDESDFEEVIPPPTHAPSPPDGNHSTSRAGTPGPGSSQNASASAGSRNVNKLPISQSTSLKAEKPQSRPPSRSSTPAISGGHSRTTSSHAVLGSGLNQGSINSSRAASPQLLSSQLGSTKVTHSRAGSPMIPSSKPTSPTSTANHTTSNGKRKQPPTGPIMTKDKRMNSGPGPLHRASSSTSGNTPSASPSQSSMMITKEQVIEILRNRTLTTKELLSHFKLALKEEQNRSIVMAIMQEVATITDGRLILKEGL